MGNGGDIVDVSDEEVRMESIFLRYIFIIEIKEYKTINKGKMNYS